MLHMNNTLSIKGKRLGCFLLFYLFTFLPLMAQFNTDRLVMVGRSAYLFTFNGPVQYRPLGDGGALCSLL